MKRAEDWEIAPVTGVRPPLQSRSRRTFDRVLDVGAQLLAERGYDGFSISEVCRLARVSPGSLYTRVDGIRSLFMAIHRREMDRILAERSVFEVGARWDRLDTNEFVREVIRELCAVYARNAGLLRAFIIEAARDDELRAQGSAATARYQQAIVDLLATRADEFRPMPDPHAAIVAICQVIADSLSFRTAMGQDFGNAAGGVQWVEQLAEFAAASLLGGAVRSTVGARERP
jgi:AcrR family transcriptional regulator